MLWFRHNDLYFYNKKNVPQPLAAKTYDRGSTSLSDEKSQTYPAPCMPVNAGFTLPPTPDSTSRLRGLIDFGSEQGSQVHFSSWGLDNSQPGAPEYTSRSMQGFTRRLSSLRIPSKRTFPVQSLHMKVIEALFTLDDPSITV